MGRQAGIRIGDGELNQAFEVIAENNGMTIEAFIETLASEGASYEELRAQVRKEMIIQRVQRGKVGRQGSDYRSKNSMGFFSYRRISKRAVS